MIVTNITELEDAVSALGRGGEEVIEMYQSDFKNTTRDNRDKWGNFVYGNAGWTYNGKFFSVIVRPK